MDRRRFIAGALALLASSRPARAGEPAILLANLYREAIDPADYWISEKLDGVRAVWDGKTLRHRSGNVVRAPQWFTDALPPVPLDGELWLARQRFDALSAIVRKEVPIDDEWRQVRYMIFEMPEAPGDFTARIALMRATIDRAEVPWLHVVEQFRVRDRQALAAKLQAVVTQGAEGLMLHRADAPYTSGRSDALLKLKPLQDAEARVVGHIAGKGRNAGRLGALLLETPEGQRFKLGTGFSDAARNDPPPVGALVTYRYRDLTSTGLPRFASFLRVREVF